MDLKLIKCDWGMENYGDMKVRLHNNADAGYDGLEWADYGSGVTELKKRGLY